MHLLQTITNAEKYLELSIEGEDNYPWQRALFVSNSYEIAEEKVNVLGVPGLGG